MIFYEGRPNGSNQKCHCCYGSDKLIFEVQNRSQYQIKMVAIKLHIIERINFSDFNGDVKMIIILIRCQLFGACLVFLQQLVLEI